MLHSEELLHRDRILDAVWGWNFVTGTRSVDARIVELRKAIAEYSDTSFIETSLIFIISLSDLKAAKLVMRIRIEVLIASIGVLICLCWGGIHLIVHTTKRHKLSALGLQKKQLKDEHQRFMRRLDHELKNPLTGIQLGLENLKLQAPESANKIAELKSLSQRLSQITTDLRKLAFFEEQAQRKLSLSLPTAPWPVPNISIDRDLIQLAVYNLIENALKYSDKGDRIEVRATDQSGTVKIEIADTGIGIPADELKSVWEELFRASNGRHRKGTGIGLSLVRRIIERHEGSMGIDSIEQKGTRISILLPINS